MSRSAVETILGGVVLVVAIGFFVWAYGRSNVANTGGYQLTAQFDRVDGLNVGGEVRISGIPVGKVVRQELDPATYRAKVTFTVQDGIELPADTSAQVASSSLLGGRYLALVPGSDDVMLKNGDEITITQSAVNIEDLIGRYIFSQGGGQSGAAAPPSAGGTDGAGRPGTGGGQGAREPAHGP
jgi:phospholipid/cholesterol/gamma-HCH transport system substrate-binding protein